MKITEVSTQKNNPLKVNIYVDGSYRFSLDGADAALRGIKEGRELSQKELENLAMDSQFTKARDAALGILSRKSISSGALADTLSQKGCDKAVVTEVITELESLGYIDDEAYGAMYLEYCLEKLWGKKKIRFEMKQKGLSDEIIENVLASYDDDALTELMAEYIRQRYAPLDDPRQRQRAVRHFAARGFEFSHINTAIALSLKESSDE